MVQLYGRKGGDILVNTQTASNQSTAAIAVLNDGGYVVAWTDSSLIGGDSSSSGIKAQRFDGSGNKVGAEFLVNTTTTAAQQSAQVATLPSGRFVVTWTDLSATGGDTSSRAIRGQLFEADGTPVGGEFLVNTQTAGIQDNSAITVLTGGGFVVSWTDSSGVGGDSSSSGIKAQIFDSSGAKVGGEILVNTTTQGPQSQPSLIGLPTGGFAVAWTNAPTSGVFFGSTRLQLFDSAGAKVGGEQVVSTNDTVNFLSANIAALPSGFLVTWSEQEGMDFAPTSFDVRGQMYDWNGAKVGAEFQVNTDSAGSQSTADAHALPGGGFIVTWQGPGEGLSGLNVYAQIFDSAANKLGPAFILGDVTDANQQAPEVEVLPNGDIVLVWADGSMTGADTSGFAVKSQILTVTTALPTDIVLSGTTISETALEGVPLATIKSTGPLNATYTYTIVSDSTGGAFAIAGDKLVVADNSKLDFETATTAQVRIRTIDDNGHFYEETIQLSIADTPESAYGPKAGEFLVNTSTTGEQNDPVMVPLASGGFLVQWFDTGTSTSKGQVYDAAGNKVGGEVPIQGNVAAALPGGGFVTAWAVPVAPGGTFNIRSQVYDASGAPVGGEIAVATSSGFSPYVSISASATGGFVVAWTRTDSNSGTNYVDARIFSSSGTALTTAFQASIHSGTEHEVAHLASGNFVLTWSVGGYIMGQMYTAEGVRFGVEFTVSPSMIGAAEPRVAALASGGFVVTYVRAWFGIDHLAAQVFDANGIKVGDEILVDPTPTRVGSVDVAALPWGGFIVSWTGQEDNDPSTNDAGIRAQVFDGTGQRLGDVLAVNQATANDQINSQLAVLASGDVVVAWGDASGQGGDPSGWGLKARILTLGALDNEILTGDGGANLLDGGTGDDQLFGLGGNDTLVGGAGNDLLDGGTGADSMTGGADDDIYYVDDAGDTVVENAGEGSDEVRTSLAVYTLGANVEKLTATTNSAHDYRGNALDNVLTGGSGSDFLRLQDGGNDTANGGGGNDVFLFGASMNALDSVDGGAGLDQLVLQGGGGLTFGTGVINLESIAILSGLDQRFGDTALNLYDYVLTMNDANVAAGVQMIVDANRLIGGEDLTFNGSAETDGSFFIYGGGGVDMLTGGAKNDVFLFGAQGQWGSGDVVNGGAGIDQLALRGNYTITFGANQLVGIESIALVSAHDTRFGALGSSYSYNLTMNDGNVAAGAQLIFDAAQLRVAETLTFDASAETDGSYRIFGGKNGDTITTGAGADFIQGGLGGDTLTGGGGADTFRYLDVSDSTAAAKDQILDFTPGTDKIDLSRIDANSALAGDQAFAWIGSNAFSNTAGELRATLSNGVWTVEGDTNGDGVADLVIAVTTHPAETIGAGDFLP